MRPTKSRCASGPTAWMALPALAVALLAAPACRGKKAEPKAPPPPEVTVTEVIQRDVPIGAELTATLNGFEDVEIRARVEGYLKSIDYAEGSEIRKGQPLFTIDDQPYRAKLAEKKGDLARVQSMLAKADLDVKRFTPLAAQRAISQAELDNALALQRSARAQVEAAKAQVENAALDLGYCRLVSPIDGLAGRAQRKVGDLVGKGEPTLLTTVSSIDPIRVTVNIPEALYLKYSSELPVKGAAAPARPTPERPGAELVLADGSVYPQRGRIVLVDRAVDPTTGTLRADLSFANPKKILRPGLYGKVRYAAERRAGAVLVPQRAVQELQGQYSVVVVNAENKAETRQVKVGPRVGTLWIIDQGVKPGEKVIVEGAQKVKDGVIVKATVVPAEEAPKPEGAPPAAGAPPPAPEAKGSAPETKRSARTPPAEGARPPR